MRITSAAAIVLLAACTDAPTEGNEAVVGTVELEDVSATRIAGAFVTSDDTLTFEARELEPSLIIVTLKLNGLTFDSTLDTRDGNRMWSQDAFASDSGEDTTITEPDIQLMAGFVKAIEAENIGVSLGDGLAFHFGVVINYWAQWIPAMDPTRIKFEDRDRAIDMCGWAKYPDQYHNYDGHDCDSCNGDPVQGQGRTSCSAYVAYGPYYGTGGTWYWTSSTGWLFGEDLPQIGHGNGSYQTGLCYGRYGAGCGGGNAYFQENGSHDNCVRNGHADASWWCSDELTRTTSPYNCW